MFHILKPLQRRRDIHGYIPIVIYSNTLPCTHAGSCYTLTDVILVRGDRGIKTSSCFIRFVNKNMKFKSLEQCTIIYGNSNGWSNLNNRKINVLKKFQKIIKINTLL